MRINNRLIPACLNCLAAILAFLAVALTIRKFFPPYVPTVTPKLAFFTQHKDEFDTLFVGSS